MNSKIIFVYNADSSLEHQLFDFLHKAVSPATYPCSLCSITYGTFRIKEEWRVFLKSLPLKVEFLYRNQFRRYHSGFKTGFPVVMLQQAQQLKLLIDPQELKGLDLEGLMKLLEKRLAEAG